MKFLKKFFIIVVLLLVVIGFIVFKMFSPEYQGELQLKNIKEKVVVYYDDNGVPHITAKNQEDAYTALGYVHAQDRLWQMELLRRIAPGRLSEIFGKDMISVDKFMLGLGIEDNAYKTIATLDKSSKSFQLTKAYLNGVNQFIEEGKTPIEFYLVGVEKEKYTVKDIYNVFGYMAFSFAAAHKTDPLLNEIYNKLGSEYLEELGIPFEGKTIMKTEKNPVLNTNLTAGVHAILNKLPVPMLIGSNSWVIGADRTKNGKVIFANDPHIQYGQPSVWYQSYIKTPNYEMYGFNMALTPFPLLGHNRDYAYGLTMFENDDVDFYKEKNNPQNPLEYQTGEGYQRYKTIEKRIKVKDQKDTTIVYKISRHGTIMNGVVDQIKDENPIAMQWIYTRLPNKLLEVSYQLSHSDSLTNFKETNALLHAPGLNIMYGDAQNNIARFSSAKLYRYRDSVNTKVYLDGASGKDEILSYLDFSENPQSINPKINFVYSANNQVDSVAGKIYPGYYLPEDRAKRIVEIIEPKYDFTQKDVEQMLLDNTSSTATGIIAKASEVIDFNGFDDIEKDAFDKLSVWDGNHDKKEVAPTIYRRFVYEFLKNTFEDEFGENFNFFMMKIPLQKKIIGVQMEKSTSLYWDNLTTKNVVETKTAIVTKSFKDAVAFLKKQLGANVEQWNWSKVLVVEHEHPIGKAGELLRKIFNVGPFETDGGSEVINNQIHHLDSTGYYKVTAGPSTRRVIDFSNVENAKAILPTGQSGNRFSPYYKNQAEKYLKGQFVKMIINPSEYKHTDNRLVFLPVPDED